MVFDQIADDASFEWSATVTASLIDSVAAAISDYNPIHMSHVNAVEAGFSTRVFHGVGLIGLISAAVANNLPGPGSILLKIDSSFLKPAYLGDDLSLQLRVTKKYKSNNTVRLSYSILNDRSDKLALGSVSVLVPASGQ